MRRNMKLIVSAFLALFVLAALPFVATTSKHMVRPVYAQNGCSVATLSGAYATIQTGFAAKNTMGDNPLPAAAVGVTTFDGAGNFSVTFTNVGPGKPDGYRAARQGAIAPGTYTVNSDCTGSLSVTSGDFAGVTADFVIIGGGTEVFGINTTPFVIATLDFKKQ